MSDDLETRIERLAERVCGVLAESAETATTSEDFAAIVLGAMGGVAAFAWSITPDAGRTVELMTGMISEYATEFFGQLAASPDPGPPERLQ